MIIVDFHQTMIAHIMVNIYNDPNYVLNESLIRHGILNSLRYYNQRFRREFGDLIVSCDSNNSWRYDIFPYYKGKRKKDKEESDIDWDSINDYMTKIKEELKEFVPFPTIQVDKAESDDIIATLVFKRLAEKNVIISRDKDFRQLLMIPGTKQFNPIDRDPITKERGYFYDEPNPKRFLFEQICRGDQTDGIPNILSEDNCLMIGKRQKPVYQKKMDKWYEDIDLLKAECNNDYFIRNRKLIDLSMIPVPLMENIVKEYKQQSNKKDRLIEYFMKYNLAALMENYQDFV